MEKAPETEEIKQKITSFFWENTVIIWHNIAFDLNFLNKFFPDLKYSDSIDTFKLAQNFIHYQASYSLETLIPGENAHDALQDTKNAIQLFQKIVKRIQKLKSNYPILQQFISNENFSLSKYIWDCSIPKTEQKTQIKDIPRLNKIMWSYTQIKKIDGSIDTDQLENQKRYYLGNTNLKSFLEKISSNKNIILSFSNLQKLNIAKAIFNKIWLKNLGFLKDDQIIDYDKFEAFLNKKEFNNDEVLFVCKYYSHVEQWLWLLDLNNKSDFQIYHAIKSKKEKAKYPIILSTHQWLFGYIWDPDNQYQDYEILFFDAEWRYKSYNLFLSRPLDMYYTLNFLETLIYKQNLNHQISTNNTKKSDLLDQFYLSFQIFIGQLFIDSKHLFTGNNLEVIQSNPIINNPDFYKSMLLWQQIRQNLDKIQPEIEEKDFSILKKQFLHIDRIFDTVIDIHKKMAGDTMNFVYSEHTKYTSWSEFIEIFPSNIFFFSTSDKNAETLFPDIDFQTQIPTKKIWLYQNILEYIQNLDNTKIQKIFILSTRKNESSQIFESLYKNNLHKQYTIVAENITWWVGKNILKLKNQEKSVIIGWYAFLLALYSENIPLDEIVIFNIRGNNEQSILDDIQRYANK